MINVFGKILNDNWGLGQKISESEKISLTTITTLKKTGKGSPNIKFKIFSYLLLNNYIGLGQYTITKLFEIKEENE